MTKAAKPPLTPKQQRFVQEYLIDLNATQAAIRAGYSAKTAEVQGPRLVGNVRVAQAVAVAQKAIGDKLGITAERVLLEVARIAFADPRELFDADGHMRPIHELSEDIARCVASVEVVKEKTTITNGDKAKTKTRTEEYTTKPRLWDKPRSLDLLMRHLGLMKDKMEIGGKVDVVHRRVTIRISDATTPKRLPD